MLQVEDTTTPTTKGKNDYVKQIKMYKYIQHNDKVPNNIKGFVIL